MNARLGLIIRGRKDMNRYDVRGNFCNFSLIVVAHAVAQCQRFAGVHSQTSGNMACVLAGQSGLGAGQRGNEKTGHSVSSLYNPVR